MYNEIITYYAKNPVNKKKLGDYSIKYFEDNRTCWNDLIVYLKIKNNKISNWSFDWDTSMITTACASIFWESIIGKNLNEVLKLDYNYIEKLVGLSISDKRKSASVFWLLSTRNAIHSYLKDGKMDSFDDVLQK